MSLFGRPNVALAIVFGCLVVLIPRILLPYFRPKSVYRTEDHFRQSSSSINYHHDDNIINTITESSTNSHNIYSGMQTDHSDTDLRTDELVLKQGSTFVLPMYTVGIAVFIIYTCFKYVGSRKSQEQHIRSRYSPTNIQWNAQKKQFNYQANNRQTFYNDDDEQEEESYAGLDADYVEYLKQKRREEREHEQAITTEQKQMHNTLDEMKHSLSFISSKLGTNTKNMTLTNNEIIQLQDRLAATEAQMYKILNTLDAASNKINEITRNSRQSLEQPAQNDDYDEDNHRSLSESEDEENSSHEEEEEEHNENERKEDSSSSSSDEEDEVSNEYEDDESESSSSDRYGGLMNTNYACDPSTIDDHDLDDIKKPEETTDSQTKVQEWRERNHSQSLSSNNSSIGEDQSIPNEQENHLRRRKHQEKKR